MTKGYITSPTMCVQLTSKTTRSNANALRNATEAIKALGQLKSLTESSG